MRPVPPPDALIRSLVDGPSVVTDVQWFDEVDSTNRVAAEAARAGAAEGLLVLSDTQTAGRGRLGRRWVAAPGTSLLLSLLLRPFGGVVASGTLPLVVGVALADTVSRHLPGADVALKWPNDLLVGDRKAGGILVEAVADAVVVGVGVDVDWRGAERPAELAGITSLAEAAGRDVDRWRVLAGFAGVLSRRYGEWNDDRTAFLAEYRERCATLGAKVRVALLDRPDVRGHAVGIDDDGRLVVAAEDGRHVAIATGDVEHVRGG